MSLEKKLVRRIRDEGPITVADFMRTVLFDPRDGYYTNRTIFGSEGDFVTSPEITQVFGELIGAWIYDCWVAQGCPKAALLELGPGRGMLMSDILRVCKDFKEDFIGNTDVYMLEGSPKLRKVQEKELKGMHPRIRWIDRLDELPELPLFFVTNEFFDALPIHQFVTQESGEKVERMVTINEKEELCFQPEGEVTEELCPEAEVFAEELSRLVAKNHGAGLIIDYGYHLTSKHRDTLRGIKEHKVVDVFETPGYTDISAWVDFTRLARKTMDGGAVPYGPVEQGTLFKKLGAELRAAILCRKHHESDRAQIIGSLEQLLSRKHMGESFLTLAVMHKEAPPPDGFGR